MKNASNRSRRFKFIETVLTDVGRRRNENQDAYGIAHTDEISLFIVADGMGGARGGATASSLAVHVVTREAFESSGKLNAVSLKNSIECANAVIFNKSKTDEDLSGMGTTIVALAFVGEQCVVAHVGDSRIYRLRENELEQLTRDHTLVQELVDTGAIPPEEAADHPIAHMLTRSLGPTDSIEVEVRVLPDLCEVDDQFLLCSDGLYNLVTDEEIAQSMATKEPEEAARELVDLALERGGTDNVTVEILRLTTLNDSDASVEYPSDSVPTIKLSEPSEVPSIDEMIAAVQEQVSDSGDESSEDAASENEAADAAAKVTDEGSGESEAIEDAGEEDTEEEETQEPLPDVSGALLEKAAQNAGGREFRFLQLAGAVIGLSALGAVAFVFINLESSRGGRSGAAVSEASSASERDELSEELAVWAKNNEATVDTSAATEDRLQDAIEEQTEVKAPTSEEIAKIVGTEETTEEVPEEDASEPEEVTLASATTPAEEEITDEEIEAKVEELSNLEVGPPPVVDIRAEELDKIPANQPIVWENEALKLARVREQQEQDDFGQIEAKPREAEEPVAETSQTPTLPTKILASEEASDVLEQKVRVRERIEDLDVKLRLLSYNSEAEIRQQASELRLEKVKSERLLEETREKLSQAKERVETWLDFQRKSSTVDNPKTLADEVAEISPELSAKREKYTQASRDYLQAVDEWQAEPNDLTAASKMGALGRTLQQRRQEYEDGVVIAIAQGVETSINEVTKNSVALERLEEQTQQLSRHLGYYEGFTPLAAERKRDLKSSYLSDRKSLVSQLDELKKKLSDTKEKELFRQQVSADYPINNPASR